MKYWAILFISIFQIQLTFGQTPLRGTAVQPSGDRLTLVSSRYSYFNDQNKMINIKPVYEHKGNTLSADSGYVYEDEIKRQFFEAFGNVVITQPSGTVIYSNYLHYDASAQQARLTGNVRMVDGTSTLTTNHLTYNMRLQVGTYSTGGRIVSRGDTITSKNATYFKNSSDAYFRNKVIVRSANVKVYTDSMRYNSISKNTYFSGPTNIKGNKGENLYTERGIYNTGTGIADFNKNNLYTEGTKFLKGDSLHYERAKGIGEAFRNVVFVDTLDKFYAYGGKGLYLQGEESIMMTEKPLIITLVKGDSTNQSSADSTKATVSTPKSKKEIKKEQKELEKQEKKQDKELIDITGKPQTDSIPPARIEKIDSVFMTADTLFSKIIPVKEYKPLQLNLDRSGGQLISEEEPDYGDEDDNDGFETNIQDSTQIDENTISKIKIEENTKKDPLKNTPTTKKKTVAKIAQKTQAPNIAAANINDPLGIEKTLKADSVLRQKTEIPKGNEANTLINEALKVAQTTDTLKKDKGIPNKSDSTKNYPDTAKTRIVRAFYNVRLFKSDLQAVADSAYYGMVDSMFRFMGKPMIWSQGSQISADTIYMQIINQQMDNALLKDNAFMVNAVLDSVKFNQLKGRKITAFFANNNIDRLFVDGNAENLVFNADDKLKIIKDMFHDRGARIKIKMENKEIIDYVTIQKVDQKIYPFKLVTQENEVLKGFIWRPQDRPTSKEDLLNRKRDIDRTDNTPGNTQNSTKQNENPKDKVVPKAISPTADDLSKSTSSEDESDDVKSIKN